MVLFNLYDDWLKSIPSYTVRSIIIIMIMRSLYLSNYLVHVHEMFLVYFIFPNCQLLYIIVSFRRFPD